VKKLDDRYLCKNEDALYSKNQGIIKRFFILNIRLAYKKLLLVLKEPKPFFIRKLVIRKSLRLQKPKQHISDNGVSELYGKDLPYFDNIFNYWLERSQELIKHKKLKTSEYSRKLLKGNEILMHTPTLNFALSHELLSIIGEYFGTAPSLAYVDLWWGRAGEQDAGSPCFHLDSLDTSCIRMYVYLCDVSEDNGPFCVIPKKESFSFIRKTGYLGNSLSDETVFKEIPSESLRKLTGDAGSVFAIDATNCLHYGSRGLETDRVAMIFSYASYHNHENNAEFLESLPKLNNPTSLQEMAYDHISIR